MAQKRSAAARLRKWARRQVIVNRGFQLRALLPLVIYTVAMVLLVEGLVFFPLGRDIAAEPDEDVRVLMQEHLSVLHLRLWPIVVFAGFWAAIYTLLRSNRVAGPLYRLRHVLERLGSGEARTVRFREGDEFREFEAVVANLNRRLQFLATRNRDAIESAEFRLRQLSRRLDTEPVPPEELQGQLKDVLGLLAKTHEAGAGAGKEPL